MPPAVGNFRLARRILAVLALAAALPAAAEEPEAAYAKFHRAAVSGDLEEMARYATGAQRAELTALSPAQKAAQVKMLAALMPRAYVLRSKNVNPDGQGARLLVSGAGPSLADGKPETLYGSARLVMEGGDWKVASVDWTNQDPGPAATAAPAKAAKPAAAPKAAASRAAPAVGSMDNAPERRLGTQKPPCVYKPVMTQEDLENCR